MSSQIGARPAARNRGRRAVRALRELQLRTPQSETRRMRGEDVPSAWRRCANVQGQHGSRSGHRDFRQHSGGVRPTIRPSSVAYRASPEPSALPYHLQLNGICHLAKTEG